MRPRTPPPPPPATVVSLGRMRNYLEYRRLPGWMVPLVIHELLGVLFIRCVKQGGLVCISLFHCGAVWWEGG